MTDWFHVGNAADIPSPALLIYPDRVKENIHRMIQIAGGVERLRPHMKTHKLAEVIRMQMEQGIAKFKCATIAEAEMVASCGAADVLLAYQPVGPNIQRVVQLVESFPQTKFPVIADDAEAIRALSAAVAAEGPGSARGPRAPVGGSPTGMTAEEYSGPPDISAVQTSSTAQRAAAPNTPAACAPPSAAKGARYSKRNLPHFEKPWAIYAVHFTTSRRRKLGPAARQIVLDCIVNWHGRRYRLIAACVMPDHVHFIIQPGIESTDAKGNAVFHSLGQILHTIKSYTAHAINKAENVSGGVWEKESFDRYVRSDGDLAEKFHYICRNPWDSGVVQASQPYPWLWTPETEAWRTPAEGMSRKVFAAHRLEEHASGARSPGLEVLLDIDCGQRRTGIAPGPKAVELYRLIASLPGLNPGGLHAYDGHIHDSDVAVRAKNCEAAYAPVIALRRELEKQGLPIPLVVAGGTPTFPMHARRGDVECSPGTCVFWDAGYAKNLPDLDFIHAAVLLTRVVSKPGANRLCLDLGHKAVASEMPHPRVQLLNLPDAKAVAHNEEHLVVETAEAGAFKVGDCLYGIPWHICPTVALHSEAVVVENGKATTRWRIAARERKLTI
jgi:D-serine deaminase-like pyridoxal phosphate-dependent protein/REP element-mobilizing transposase RayT